MHPEYREWYEQFLRRTIGEFSLDAVVITESFFTGWPGLSNKTTRCFCDLCRAELARRLSLESVPALATPEERRAFLEDAAHFQAWVDMRVESWTDFMGFVLSVCRQIAPGMPVGTMVLAIDHPDGFQRIREANGQDAIALLERAPYDFIVLQAHWPDWMKPGLTPEQHAESYRVYSEAIQGRYPDVRVGMLADIGSAEACRRGSAWVRRLQVAARRAGMAFVEPYEYSVGGAMYDDPPQIIEHAVLSADRLEVVFSKRLDPESARRTENYLLDGRLSPRNVEFDGGNIVTLVLPEGADEGPHHLEVRGVRDDPAVFWFNKRSENGKWKYDGHEVPEGTVVTW
jgi:hypothetical protein